MSDEKKINDKKLEQVSGGGLFSRHSDKEYAEAGVTVVGPGTFYNDGYAFKGKEISTEDAHMLVFFYYYHDYPAESVEEAREYYDYFAQSNPL